VTLWDTTTGKLLHTIPHSGNVHGVAFSPDGRRLASTGEDKTIHVWDAMTGREVLGLHGHTDMCSCVAFTPDGQRLAESASWPSPRWTIKVGCSRSISPYNHRTARSSSSGQCGHENAMNFSFFLFTLVPCSVRLNDRLR
jgi:WD40 repeat protein